MLNLYTVSSRRSKHTTSLTNSEQLSVKYHDLFDYPLNFTDLIRWKAGKSITSIKSSTSITSKKGFYYLSGREGLIYKRLLRKRISSKKLLIAKRAGKLLRFIPTIKMVAVTGSLAMENSSEDSDIDLMIITKQGTLWTTRLVSYFVIWLVGIQRRKPNDKIQKDRLCLNIWLDKGDLVWKNKDRNIYTAHEIAQIVPLVNKNNTYEKFVFQNRWILSFWPNSLKIINLKFIKNFKLQTTNLGIIEKIAFKLQYAYMKNKITRETISPTKALFHPQDWGKVVLNSLTK